MQNLSFIIGNARQCLGTIFPDSSMVERLAVNEDVQGSSPCREAFFFSNSSVILVKMLESKPFSIKFDTL